MDKDSDEKPDKKIDESWKNSVKKEKEGSDGASPHSGIEGDAEETGEREAPDEEEITPPKPDFSFFISNLAVEALIALGEMEHPVTRKKSVNLAQAQYLIETIEMLEEKSKGNLTNEERNLVENVLAELKMRYVSKTK